MKCPGCKSEMSIIELEPEFFVRQCNLCKGIWIKAANYWRWLERSGHRLPELSEDMTARLDVNDSNNIKICPDCGHFMTRKQVGHGVDFQIDRCATCGGIWLDKNEWDVLKSRNLHDEIHYVFSQAWQQEVLSKQQALYRAQHAEEILGHHDYEKLVSVKDWIAGNPQKSFMLAYLMDK